MNYEVPAITVVEVINGGVICLSGRAGVQGYTWNKYEEE